jgi:hypothetical protein
MGSRNLGCHETRQQYNVTQTYQLPKNGPLLFLKTAGARVKRYSPKITTAVWLLFQSLNFLLPYSERISLQPIFMYKTCNYISFFLFWKKILDMVCENFSKIIFRSLNFLGLGFTLAQTNYCNLMHVHKNLKKSPSITI